MGWRIVTIENPAHLQLQYNSLCIKQDLNVVSIPIEDIDTLILDNYAISMTINLLTELSNVGVATILCDKNHLPCSIVLPYSQHSRQSKISTAQLNTSIPFRKNIWKLLIIQKIINQANVLKQFNYSESSDKLMKLSDEVKSGDASNRESVAANIYFADILDDATRRKPIWHNSALNYGYAIIRSQIARSAAGHGLIVSQGVFHHSELNSFNLADDLIEPFRAIVDEYILSVVYPKRISDFNDSKLSKEDRHLIIDISNYYVTIGNRNTAIKNAVEIMVESYVRSILDKTVDRLLLPMLRN